MAKEVIKNSKLRMPPHNLEAEKSVLGSLMLDSKAINIIVDILKPEDFYHQKHQLIYQAMFDLYEKKEPIDVLSVSSRLKEKKILDEIGGHSYLAELVNCVPTASNAKHYAEIVQKKSVLRNLIESSDHICQLGYNEEDEIDEILDEAEKKIFSIARFSIKQRFLKIKHALEEAWERFDRMYKSKGELRGIPTGFPELDNLLAGFQKSDLIILAARPSVGKTSLALDIARNVACKYNIPVGIFSLEMSSQQLTDRLLAAQAHIDSWKLRTGRLSNDDEFTRIRDALDTLASAPIFIDDEASNNIMQMRAKARRLQAEHNLGLLIVDYIQLMVPRQKTENLVQQMTEISRSLKGLARELEVPILALSQLSRAVESRNPPIPKLHDLRDSGSIEQDADVVMFIYREDRYKENTDNQNIADILIEKHRNGPLGRIKLYFNPKKVSFSSIEKGDFSSI
ncbi:MAG: replicative DNA helicase [Candidatus Terrybacteria bacterium]|nr:replicative DNA helicase [Candidatus Terrybacteria bacterium]